MFAKGQMANIMRQAQKTNEAMQEMNKKLAEMIAEGEAAAGLVKVRINGNKEMVGITISDEAMEDKEMLEDLIVAAYNNAFAEISQIAADKMAELTSSMGLPSDIKLPF